jgi:arginine exporter protein ArgO
VIARFVYACFLVLFFVGGVKGISHLVEMNPSLSPMLNWIGWIQGVLGLGLAGLFGAFRVKVEDVIQSTLGYKP